MATEPAGRAEIELTHIADHADRAVAGLPSRDRRGARKVAVTRGLAAGVQLLEDIAFDVLLSTRLGVATGAQLDVWGGIVGERRGALTQDTVYRRFVMARAQVNVCRGNSDALIAIWLLLTDPQWVYLRDAPPMGFVLYAVRATLLDANLGRRVRRTMRDAKPAAYEMALVQSPVGYFGFDGDPDALGFDDGQLSEEITG